MNPSWTSKDQHTDGKFKRAMETVGLEFEAQLFYLYDEWLPARSIVEEALEMCESIHNSKRILCLSQLCPWTDHLFELEEEKKLPPVYFVVFEGGSNMW